jgi:hypothetical protein
MGLPEERKHTDIFEHYLRRLKLEPQDAGSQQCAVVDRS